MDVDGGNKRIIHRLVGPSNDNRSQKVCYRWQAGNCTRYPCPFLHREVPPPMVAAANGMTSKRALGFADDSAHPRRTPNFNGSSTWGRVHGASVVAGRNKIVRKTEKICNYWVQGNCSYGDRCKFLHAWSIGHGFSLLTQLEGHQKVVSAIALPSGSDKLYTGSKDETVRVWDCQSGQCMAVINLGGDVGCMISEGPWVFVGIPNLIKAWNLQTTTELGLNGPVGQVYALVVGNDLLFAGIQDSSILAWKFNAITNCFDPAASLKGHSLAVVSLIVGANRLYSGSMDHTIRVWNLDTLQCVQTLTEHTSVVMSVLCWNQFLLSCSLDNTIKVWVATESGIMEVTYTHTAEHGLLALSGMLDSQSKPILLCSCIDNTVRLYDLPSFSERGKIFSKQEILAIQVGPGGLFFTGDGAGQVKVWKWTTEPAVAVK